MSNNNAIIALIVIVVLAIGSYFLFANKAAAPTTTTTTATPVSNDMTAATTTAPATNAGNFTVTYTDQGFSPKTFNVSAGTAVHFVNDSTRQMWVAVGEHPTHTTFDGTSQQQHCSAGKNTNGSFDECAGVGAGTVYTYMFEKAGTFSFHNHLRPADMGTITITQQ